MKRLFLTVVLLISFSAFAEEVDRDALNEVHHKVQAEYQDEAATSLMRIVDGIVLLGKSYMTDVYAELDAMGAKPEIVVVRVRGSAHSHVTTCAKGYCFDPVAENVVSENRLNGPDMQTLSRYRNVVAQND